MHLQSFLISAPDLGEWSTKRRGPFTPKKEPFEREAEWASEPVWTSWRREKSLARARFRTPGRLAVSLGRIPTTLFPTLINPVCQSPLACPLTSERTHLRRPVHVYACVYPCVHQDGRNKQCKPTKLASSLYLLSAWLESGTGTQIVLSLTCFFSAILSECLDGTSH